MSGSLRKDPAWKYSSEIQVPPSADGSKKGYYKYLKYNFCNKEIKGGVKRVKEHLACTRKNVASCPKVPDEVKNEMHTYMKEFEKSKHSAQQNMEEMVDSGSYFGNQSNTPQETMSNRSIRGPMDRFMNNVNDEDNDDGQIGGEGDEQKPSQMTSLSAKEMRNQVCLDIGRFFFENGIAFNCATSASFISMCRSLGNYGRGFKPPTMHELRNWILDEEVKTTSAIVDGIKETWKQTGVSILSDGSTDMRRRHLINFLVNNPHGTVFLRSIDASDVINDAELLFELLDAIVEEVGEDYVVQVVTDNASAYKAAGGMLMKKRKKLYWTPCAAHCIDLMLEKIGALTQVNTAMIKAKKVANVIYNHQWVLSLFRKFAKKDLLRPAATRFATTFLTLESMLELKQPLQMMFVSKEWSSCTWAKKDDGKAVKKIAMNDKPFWPSVVYSIKTSQPLVNVLRMVDGEATPAMGFIYAAMDEAKEKIAQNFNGDFATYKEIWDIIDLKWDKKMHRDLHAAGYYLNPRYRWSPNVSNHPEIKTGLWNCMERILGDNDLFVKVDGQLENFGSKLGMFGRRAALSSYMTRPPMNWWDYVGDEVPELKAFAMKVLGLTCSSSACERNWSTFNQVHTKRRNRLSTIRLNKLVYVMYNKKLKFRWMKKQSRKAEDDLLIVEDVPSDDEWLVSQIEPLTLEDDATSEMEDEEETPIIKRKRNQASSSSRKGKEKVVQSLRDEDEEDEWDEEDEDNFDPNKFLDI